MAISIVLIPLSRRILAIITSLSPRYDLGFLGSGGVLFLGFSGVTVAVAVGDPGFSSIITHESGSNGSASANTAKMREKILRLDNFKLFA